MNFYIEVDSDGKILSFIKTPEDMVDVDWRIAVDESIYEDVRAAGPGATWRSGQVCSAEASLDQAKSKKSELIRLACADAIASGFSSSALGGSRFYPSCDEDQRNLQSAVSAALAGGDATVVPLWCAVDSSTGRVWELIDHDSRQIQSVNADWVAWRVQLQTKRVALESAIKGAETAEAIASIAW